MRITKHASIRMQKRNINMSMVRDIIGNGIRMVNKTDSNKFTFKHKHENLYAVTDKNMSALITVFRKEVR